MNQRNSELKKLIILIGELIGIGGALAWMIYEPGFEPLLILIPASIAFFVTYKGDKEVNYNELTYARLREIAKENKIKYSNLKKKQLIGRIQSELVQHKEWISTKHRYIALFVTMLIGVIFGLYIRPDKDPFRPIDIQSGKICSYISSSSRINFQIGPLNALFPKTALENAKFDFNDMIDIGCKSYLPIEIGIQNNKPVVSMTVRSWDGGDIAMVENNKWESESQNYFKLNFDDCALEIVDKDLIPLLQIEFFENGSSSISGIFYCKDAVVFLNAHNKNMSSRSFDKFNSKEFRKYYLEHGKQIKRIFQYTGNNWYGKRE